LPSDLSLLNCRLINQTGLFDITITNGQISNIQSHSEMARGNQQAIDAGGNLVSPSFVNPHLHLCKVYTLERMDEAALREYHAADMGKAMTAIEMAARVKADYDISWILPNVRRALNEALEYGCTHIRAFADVDGKARLEGVKALLAAREEFKDRLTLQVVAFAQDGIVKEPAARDLLIQAMELGADVVGGIPWIELTDADIQEHIRFIFDLSVKYDKDVSMLVDDAGDPGLRSLEGMILETIRRKWHGRSLAHHARAMSMYPTPYLQKIITLLKQADMGIVTDPHTGPLHARVKELLAEGALVCLGQDDISDAYYPYGRNNMLEVAFLASHLLWMTSSADMQTLLQMVTTNAARAINIRDYGLEVGKTANLVILDQANLTERMRYHAAPLHVISHGQLIH